MHPLSKSGVTDGFVQRCSLGPGEGGVRPAASVQTIPCMAQRSSIEGWCCPVCWSPLS